MSNLIPRQRQPVEGTLFADGLLLVPMLSYDPGMYVDSYSQPSDVQQREWELRRVDVLREAIARGTAVGFGIHDNGSRVEGEVVAVDITSNTPQMAYWLTSESRGRGVATRAVRRVVEYVLTTSPNAEGVVFKIRDDNVPSQRVAARLGAVRLSTDEVAPSHAWRLSR